MTLAVGEGGAARPRGGSHGGRAARRAVVRWSWRLFRREWRQQALVLALLVVAVAATTAGIAVATQATPVSTTSISLPGGDPQLDADVAALRAHFAEASEVAAHRRISVPGSVATVDVRAQDTGQRAPSLRLRSGRLPASLGEVAVTSHVAELFGLRIGGTWNPTGRPLRVVGSVENPLDLGDQFALVVPGGVDPADHVTVTVQRAVSRFDQLRVPSGAPLDIQSESANARAAAAAAVLALATIGLLFVGLVAVAGFTVMAQRHLRALGVLEALGGTDRHVRLVMLANGLAVGAAAAVVGTALGIGGWLVSAPGLETAVGHRVDRFDLPWWAVGTAMALAVLTAVAAAWWPARAASRIPVVTALSGRPPRPRPAHHFAAAGAVLLAGGLVMLGLANDRRALLIIGGIVATTVGVLLVAPLAIRALAGLGRRAPVGVRLALRDLARYQARSGAALGAVTLAVGIAATIAVSAAYARAGSGDSLGNLPTNEVLLAAGSRSGGPMTLLSGPQLQAAQSAADAVASSLGTHEVVRLDAAINPAGPRVQDGAGGVIPVALVKSEPVGRGFSISMEVPVYVATPDLLTSLGIRADQVDPAADVLTSRNDLRGLILGFGRPADSITPKIQVLDLPKYDSDPNTLVSPHAVAALGLTATPAGWLVRAPHPLTSAQIANARRLAAAAGIVIETRDLQRSSARLGQAATAVGLLLALGVLAMTVGLMRSEGASDLRTLTAAGAAPRTRRTLTGATAGALGLLGTLLGTATAYLALVVWHRHQLHGLTHVPVADLVVLLVGLPAGAIAGGWVLAGREPPAIARRPLD